jgi:arylamine N-acetyltransferase
METFRTTKVGMDRSVNKLYSALLVASAIAVWTSGAQGNTTAWAPVRFPSEEEQPSVAHISDARLAQEDDDSIFFAQDRDHTDREDKNITNNAKTGSLQVCN